MTVNLYDSHYGNLHEEVQRQVRQETYGEDLGQASWITVEEYLRFLGWLELRRGSRALEVACGSGGVCVRMAQDSGAEVVGIDVNEQAIRAARDRARELPNLPVSFEVADAAGSLPFEAATYDAIFCNDSINHLRLRDAVLRDWHRLLRPGGRLLYTDPIVVTGALSNEEIAVRSSIGFFLFVPVGTNERALGDAGFRIVRVEDVTEGVIRTSARWRDARARRREALVRFEGEEPFDGVQRFLGIVHTLSSERRLSRFAYLAIKD